MKRADCIFADCRTCVRAQYFKCSFWNGERLYKCDKYRKPHRVIYGLECSFFKCSNSTAAHPMCEQCEYAKDAKE